MSTATIRAYERTDLPLSIRLPSLARRFECLNGAKGLEPWNEEQFYNWVNSQPHNSAAYQTGLLLLNLSDYKKADTFDILKAAGFWNDNDKHMFIDFIRIWKF
jgi:hypothetical protein